MKADEFDRPFGRGEDLPLVLDRMRIAQALAPAVAAALWAVSGACVDVRRSDATPEDIVIDALSGDAPTADAASDGMAPSGDSAEARSGDVGEVGRGDICSIPTDASDGKGDDGDEIQDAADDSSAENPDGVDETPEDGDLAPDDGGVSSPKPSPADVGDGDSEGGVLDAPSVRADVLGPDAEPDTEPACEIADDCADQEDGDLCNGTFVCEDGNCVFDPGTVVACDTSGDEECKETTCDPASGLCETKDSKAGALCDDGDACTAGDVCVSGECVGVLKSCADEDPCKVDECDPATGCSNVALNCDDGNDCTTDACDPVTGCTTSPLDDGLPCDDGSPCTWPDACAGGSCAGPAAGFDKTFGGSGTDVAHALVALPDGGFAMAGGTSSKGVLSAWGDSWLVRVDAQGALLWDRTYGGSNQELALALAAFSDGDFALAGYTNPDGSGPHTDMWLVRTNVDGEQLWERTIGGSGHDEATSLVSLSDSGLAVAGWTDSKGAGGDDMWLVRTNSEGQPLWDRTFGGLKSDYARALAALPDGGFALAGSTSSKTAGQSDMWLVRTDATGELIWDESFGGTSVAEVAYALAALPDGGFAMAGYAETQSGPDDAWLVRTDSGGNLLWDNKYAGSGDALAFALVALSDGGFALAGQTDSAGSGATDILLVRTDAVGELLWDRTFGGAAYDVAKAVAAVEGGGFAMAGATNSKGCGDHDMWLVVTADAPPGADPGSECAGSDECVSGACLEVGPSTCEPVEGVDCCFPKDTPGCADETCQDQICGPDPFCCEKAWDGACAIAADQECSACSGDGGPGGP